MSTKVLVLNGPNLDRLGTRQPEIYGTMTLADIAAEVASLGAELGVETELRQTNDEGQMVDWLHEAVDSKCQVILNPAAFTHYSYALADAAVLIPEAGLQLIEIHLSNPASRESFRAHSVISPVASGVIAGFGNMSYTLALRAIVARLAASE